MRGRAVSRGVAIGKITQLIGTRIQFPRTPINPLKVSDELKRFERAISMARMQLNALLKKRASKSHTSQKEIIEAQLLMLDDPSLSGEIARSIAEEHVSFEWAVVSVTERFRRQFEKNSNGVFHERALDVQDICNKLLSTSQTLSQLQSIPKDSIVVAREITPATLIELSRNGIAGVITERGGWTSHAFILARELGIASVTGIKNASRLLRQGSTAIVDGFSGTVFVSPSALTFKSYTNSGKRISETKNKQSRFQPRKSLVTLDGLEIRIRVNLDRIENYERARKFGAHGVGLFRSELLLESQDCNISEKEQTQKFTELMKSSDGQPVNIRTFDFDLNTCLPGVHDDLERNPALGLRGIRWNILDQKPFREQISALLRSSSFGDLGIVIPMVSDLREILFAKEIIQRETRRLKKRGVKVKEPRLGAMIEVPSAAILCDVILQEVDFLCLGTNDLVQYLLAVDRDNESVANFFRTIHPAVLKVLKNIFVAAEARNKPVTVCGEMAGSTFYSPILIGLGATDLSMNSRSIPKVQEAISNIALDEAREIAEQLLNCSSADESEKRLQEFLKKRWRHITGYELSS